MKKIFLLLLSAVLGLGGWYAYTQKALGQENAEPADKLVARAEKRDINTTIEISGDVTPAFQLDVKPEVGGKLKALHVEPGE
ncbi:MAG TPA: hypothetical protein VGO90_15020, partial [Chthoniobacteraceae bacterium]|nr:hypothetical protein [Chthoniobacteraceae bacterium]